MMINHLEVEGTKDLETKLARYSAEVTNKELEKVSSTCFVLGRVTPKKPTKKSVLFGYDSWSKIYHEFVTMNAGLGNRNALEGWPKLLICPLCRDLTCYLFQRGFHCRVSVFVEAGPYLTGVDIRPNTLIEQWIIGTFTM